jgi:hypothetical protein
MSVSDTKTESNPTVLFEQGAPLRILRTIDESAPRVGTTTGPNATPAPVKHVIDTETMSNLGHVCSLFSMPQLLFDAKFLGTNEVRVEVSTSDEDIIARTVISLRNTFAKVKMNASVSVDSSSSSGTLLISDVKVNEANNIQPEPILEMGALTLWAEADLIHRVSEEDRIKWYSLSTEDFKTLVSAEATLVAQDITMLLRKLKATRSLIGQVGHDKTKLVIEALVARRKELQAITGDAEQLASIKTAQLCRLCNRVLNLSTEAHPDDAKFVETTMQNYTQFHVQSAAALRAKQQSVSQAAPAHGHSHNGQPCHGHGAAPRPKPAEMHGHSHNGQPCHGHGAAPKQQHGHSHAHGNHGHSHGRNNNPRRAQAMHGHSHNGRPCHGHGAAPAQQQQQQHGHSHAHGSHGHSHGGHGHSHGAPAADALQNNHIVEIPDVKEVQARMIELQLKIDQAPGAANKQRRKKLSRKLKVASEQLALAQKHQKSNN